MYMLSRACQAQANLMHIFVILQSGYPRPDPDMSRKVRLDLIRIFLCLNIYGIYLYTKYTLSFPVPVSIIPEALRLSLRRYPILCRIPRYCLKLVFGSIQLILTLSNVFLKWTCFFQTV
jgi:hypothetical protein